MYLKSTKDIKRRGESMIKKLAPYMKKYKTQLRLGVLCAALEAIFELLIPLVMAQIVDVGISNGNTTYTIKMGLLMLVMAAISLSFGIGLSKFSVMLPSLNAIGGFFIFSGL